jgi:mannose-1-phosphate guanylyltransferase
MYAVILAGGGGTRLWPLSRPETPKPFLPLLGERSLLGRTVDRLVGHRELDLRIGDVTVVTDRRYGAMVREQLPGVRVVTEPMGRNTAAAIALAVAAIDRPEDEVMLVLPADHVIAREDVFRSVLAGAERLAHAGAFGVDGPLVTLGIQVDRPATEYGYLIPDVERRAHLHGLDAYPLRAFEEKPAPARAVELQRQPGVAWNAGIFLWRRGSIRAALDRHTSLLTLLAPVWESEAGLAAAYESIRDARSIDYAVMEGAARNGRVLMAAADVGWNDLGSWSALLGELGGRGSGRVVQANEAAEAGPGDLVVERAAGRLAVERGPRAILAPAPSALLADAAQDRAVVEALLDRVNRWEVRS